MLARDLELLALTGGRYHVAHMSAAASVRLVRDAKRRGLPVTCEVTPHHLTLTDDACVTYETFCKCNPPLRGRGDIEALKEALVDGTVDAIATDHAPHSPLEKQVEFENAAFGMIGFETALSLCLDLVASRLLTVSALVRLLSPGPASVLGLPGGRLRPGDVADLTVIDPDRVWTCDPARIFSKSKNTPFAGRSLKGKAMLTVVGGRIAYAEDSFLA
jgi:dihydroorotase